MDGERNALSKVVENSKMCWVTNLPHPMKIVILSPPLTNTGVQPLQSEAFHYLCYTSIFYPEGEIRLSVEMHHKEEEEKEDDRPLPASSWHG